MSTIVWFSCGAASAVTARIALRERDDVRLIYCDTLSTEHPDNRRFLEDCERWLGREIEIIHNGKYADTWDVFKRTKYLAGVGGARCTIELKKRVRQQVERPYEDEQAFGFTVDEAARADRFRANNPEARLWAPLIEHGFGKEECFSVLQKAGIALPAMYLLGYRNNNCVGCVKGGAGYWNKIRVDFPDVFARMALVEREMNVAICKSYATDGERKRVFLDELPPDMGRYADEPSIECGLLCVGMVDELATCD